MDLATMRGGNHLRRRLEKHLLKMAVIKQTRLYKYCEKELRTGEVIGIDTNGALHVEVEIVPGEPIIAHCPSSMLSPKERGSFAIGSKAQFHLRRIEAVALNGTPRLKVVVDRISKTLVEKLLRRELGYLADGMTIHCIKRYVGGKSFVETSHRIPKEAILAVGKELGEHIEVKIRREERAR